MPKHQFSLELIERRVAKSVIQQRNTDGWINASDLCKAASKHWFNYLREENSGKFLRKLASELGVTQTALTQEVQTEEAGVAHVWVHPQVAIHLAQWLSADFSVLVSKWVFDWMQGKGAPPRSASVMPYHIGRHMANVGKIPATHFSILQEMTFTLLGPLEAQGYTLPESMVPDISQGLMFAKFAREKLGIDTDSLPTYLHEYPDGRTVPAKLYPIEHLADFRRFINDVWMPERAQGYFKPRDPKALPLLDRILQVTYQQPKQLPSRKRRPTHAQALA